MTPIRRQSRCVIKPTKSLCNDSPTLILEKRKFVTHLIDITKLTQFGTIFYILKFLFVFIPFKRTEYCLCVFSCWKYKTSCTTLWKIPDVYIARHGLYLK